MERFGKEEIQAVERVIRSGNLSPFFSNFKGGEQVRAFEKEFAEYLGRRYAVSVCNGTVALELALQAMGIRRGDEVITTALSFIATGTAILRVDAKPVFVDIEPKTLNINPEEVKTAITRKTKAIIPVSLNGYPCQMDELIEVADDIMILEDAAQALGAEFDGQKIGTFGEGATFSFQQSKTLSTGGEGGMFVTDDPDLYERALNIRNHGNIYGTMTDVCCTNLRLSEMQSAFGREQLLKLDRFNRVQTENAEYFMQKLKPPPFHGLYSYPLPEDVKPSYYLMPVVDNICHGYDRAKFLEWAAKKHISCGRPGQNIGFYRKLIYESPIFSGAKKHPCPVAEWAKDHILLFDIHRWKSFNAFKKEVFQILLYLKSKA